MLEMGYARLRVNAESRVYPRTNEARSRSIYSPTRRPAAAVRAAAPVQPAAALCDRPALRDAALEGYRDGQRAALGAAALLAGAAVSGHAAAAGHAVVGPQLLPRWLNRAVVP